MSCLHEVFPLGRREVTRSNTILEGPQALSQKKDLYVERQGVEFGFRTAKLLKSLCSERISTTTLTGEAGTFISVRGSYLCKALLARAPRTTCRLLS